MLENPSQEPQVQKNTRDHLPIPIGTPNLQPKQRFSKHGLGARSISIT